MVCKVNDIARHQTVTGTLKQNGLVKRFNKTILERIRYMLLSVRVQKAFLDEAIATATYSIKKIPLNFS